MPGAIVTFSGKGGSGKTTLTSLVLRHLVRAGRKPILAVDADPNASLGLTLGVEVSSTIADLRENMGEAARNPTEISKERLMDRWLPELLCEQEGFDLLTMGRPEGPKCYCYVNGLLRRYLGLLRKNYACVLVDCEAGMEYLSRLVVDDVETIVFVAEDTKIGLTTAERIAALAGSLPIRVRRKVLAVNKVARPGTGAAAAPPRRRLAGMEAVVEVPFDSDVARRCIRGEPIEESAALEARAAIEEIARVSLGLSADKTAARLCKNDFLNPNSEARMTNQ